MRSLHAMSCVALLVVLTGLSEGAEPSLVHTRLFENGKLKNGQNVFYRIPAITVAKDGTILAFANGRVGIARDHCPHVQAVLRRSKDNGKTWGPKQVLFDRPGWGGGNCAAVTDPVTGEIMFETLRRPASAEARKAYAASPEPRELSGALIGRSRDNGQTWKFERMITEPNRNGMIGFSGGSASGIVLKTGPKKGRLMIPGRSGYKHCGYNCALYSDNHGKTWKTSGFVPGGEGCVVELSDGRLYFNSRIGPEGWRLRAVSKDQGETWGEFAQSQWLRDCTVGTSDSAVAVPESVAGRHLIVFANPTFYRPRASYWDRRKMTATVSLDDAKTWPVKKTIYEGPSGYSAATLAADGSILVLYEKGEKFYRDKGISLAQFNVAWLFDGKDPKTLAFPKDMKTPKEIADIQKAEAAKKAQAEKKDDTPAWARASDAQKAAARKLGIPVAFENPFGMRFVFIPAGTFMMGTRTTPEDFVKNCAFVPEPKERWIMDESPRHEVTLTTSFYMSMCELSQGEAAKIVGKSKEKLPKGFAGPDMPVCVMDYPRAMQFCRELRAKETSLKGADAAIPHYTLPTEAQWEYACRAGTETEYSFGDVSSTDRVNYHGDHPYGRDAKKGLVRNRPVPCGSLPPNPWGLHEMHGNVHEWMLDCYAAKYPRKAVTDPVGPEKGDNIWILYCIRGGSWRDFAHACRSSFRIPNDWWHRRDWYNSGLRIVIPLDAQGKFAAPKPKEEKK